MAIYKYLAPNRVDVLKNATLRATQPTALNDPFEIKPILASAIRRDELHSRIREKGVFQLELKNAFDKLPEQGKPPISSDQFLEIIQASGLEDKLMNLLGLELDHVFDTYMPTLTEQITNLVHGKLGGMVGIVSFTDDPEGQLMWAHYADSHRGFVLGFDESHPFFDRRRSESDEFFHLRPVEYFDPLPTYSSIGELDGARMFCAKHADWGYERERRLLIPLSGDDDPDAVHLIAFPRDMLSTVILGERSPKAIVEGICAVLEDPAYSHVEIKQARVDVASRKIRLDPFV